MQTILMNTKNSNTTDSHKFVFNLSQRSDLRSSDKLVALQDLPIYYTWKNMKKQYNINKLKIIAPTWINEFELPDGLPYYLIITLNHLIMFQIFNIILNLSSKSMKH